LRIADCGYRIADCDRVTPETIRMTREEFKARTKAYALRVIKVVDALPRDSVSKTLGNQLLRSATSVAANYRASVRAKSPADSSPKWAPWRKNAMSRSSGWSF
jgi:hypothetical protein